MKKIFNIVICYTIAVLGILATLYKVKYEGGFITCFRELTVNGTIISSLLAFIYAIVNHIECVLDKEFEYRLFYYLRLSAVFGVVGLVPKWNDLFQIKGVVLLWKVLCGIVLGVSLLGLLFSVTIFIKGGSTPAKQTDYILVLGNRLEDGKISSNLKLRLDTAYEHDRAHASAKFILSGGSSEADKMKEYLLQKGIDRANMIIEDQANTTIENITYAKELIPEGASVTIVTNRFHAWRASWIAKKYGLENFQTVPADTYRPFAPYNYMREVCVIVKDMSKGLL